MHFNSNQVISPSLSLSQHTVERPCKTQNVNCVIGSSIHVSSSDLMNLTSCTFHVVTLPWNRPQYCCSRHCPRSQILVSTNYSFVSWITQWLFNTNLLPETAWIWFDTRGRTVEAEDLGEQFQGCVSVVIWATCVFLDEKPLLWALLPEDNNRTKWGNSLTSVFCGNIRKSSEKRLNWSFLKNGVQKKKTQQNITPTQPRVKVTFNDVRWIDVSIYKILKYFKPSFQ